MTLQLLLGWFILTMLGIGAIVASEPFWGPRRPRGPAVVVRLESACETQRAREGPDPTRRAA